MPIYQTDAGPPASNPRKIVDLFQQFDNRFTAYNLKTYLIPPIKFIAMKLAPKLSRRCQLRCNCCHEENIRLTATIMPPLVWNTGLTPRLCCQDTNKIYQRMEQEMRESCTGGSSKRVRALFSFGRRD